MPTECDASDVRPVCASNGEVFANACEMRRARRDYPALWSEVKCPATRGEDWFLCDGSYCRTGVEVCRRSEEPDDGSVVEFRCVEDTCASSGCACVYENSAGAGGQANVPDECCEEPAPGAVRVNWLLGVECPDVAL